MIEVNNKALPKGWSWGILNELGRVISGGTPSTKVDDYWGDEIAWVSPADLSGYTHKFISSGRKSLSRLGLENSSACLMPTGTVLFSSRAPIGYVAIASNPISTNQGFKSLVPSKEVFNEYIYYYFKSAKQLAEKYANGTTFKEISSTSFAHLPIPVPPLPEQHRIVEKIEELFSDLDKGIESLKTTQQQLKIYRQAVLKWAFEGKLTAKWREEKKQQGELKSAEELLVQIKAEREKRDRTQLQEWNEAVKTWETNGKQGKKPAKPRTLKKLPFLTKNEIAELPKLPETWFWTKLGEMTLGVEYGTSAKSKKQGKVIVLRMGNIQKLIFDWSDLVYSDDDEEIEKYLLIKGDILFNRTNSPELVGKTAIYQGEKPAIFAGYLIRINQIDDLLNSKYLNYFLNSTIAKNYGNKVKTDGVNQSNINGEKLISYPLPYCSLEEQHQIVQEIEFRLSICDRLEATITENLQRAEALRQSILKQAFEGKLVPQDPNDEPAEQLIERIRQEKLDSKNGKQLELKIL